MGDSWTGDDRRTGARRGADEGPWARPGHAHELDYAARLHDHGGAIEIIGKLAELVEELTERAERTDTRLAEIQAEVDELHGESAAHDRQLEDHRSHLDELATTLSIFPEGEFGEDK